MGLKNTASNYGSIAKWLHWTTALLFLGSYATFYYKEWFTQERAPEGFTALQLHFSIGITVAVLVVLRILWRMTNRVPDLELGSEWVNLFARCGHYALYAVMIIMPITGYMGTGGSTEYFFIFEIPKFEDTAIFQNIVSGGFGLSFEEFEKPFDFIHKKILGEWLLWILILGHAGAALFHHIVNKDRTLLKMTTGK